MCSRGVAAGKITAPRRRGGEDFGVAASRRGHFKPEPDPEPEPELRNYRSGRYYMFTELSMFLCDW